MKILRSWLADYIKINDISNTDLDSKITFAGIEVEEIKKAIPDSVIVAQIREIKPHPNADRLRIATVFTGKEELEIVCGAPNIEVGQKIPFAHIGTILPGNLEIKEALIRGITSKGMLCAEDELGLGDNHEGILLLPSETKPGQKVNEIISSDTVFDLKPTPNRGDCFSHLGIAREIAATTDQKVEQIEYDLPQAKDSNLRVSIENKEDCSSYYAALIDAVKIEESPLWLKDRLVAVGAKPINNIVDITNYVMLDLGQPLHAFDASRVADCNIIIRRAKDKEEITTLDGITRKLRPENLLITDPDKAIAIAGIMGGKNSEIDSNTTKIILESAQFSPTVVRKSSKLLNLSTEASYRFERGVDPQGVGKALAKAAKMIKELAGGEIIDIKSEITSPFETQEISIPYEKINSLLGLNFKDIEIDEILTRLEFRVSNGIAQIPSWRRDIAIWQDLAEEVGRIYDLNKIPANPLPKFEIKTISDYHKKEYIKDILVENGFSEVATYSIIGMEDAKIANLETVNLLEIANPVQPENKFLRNSLVPGILKSIAKNPAFDPILIFEFGNVFGKDFELTNIALAASGKNAKAAVTKAISALKSGLDIKREIEIKELTRDELIRYKIRKPITYYVELNAVDLINEANFGGKDLSLKTESKEIQYRPISKFPAMTRDLAFIVDAQISAHTIMKSIYATTPSITLVELFDEFTSDKFGIGKKNLAYHLYLQNYDRTMTDQEAEEITGNIVKNIEKEFDAKLRIA